MKKILSLALCIVSFVARAQDHDEFGWHIIEPSAKYSVLLMSSGDMAFYFQNRAQSMKGAEASVIEADLKRYQSTLPMASGEVVFVTDHFKDKYIAFDPMGRMLAFQGEGGLTEAPRGNGAGVGHILEDIQLLSGDVLGKGHFVWIVAQGLAKGTVTVLLAGGQRLEIPQTKVQLMAAEQRRQVAEAAFVPVR